MGYQNGSDLLRMVLRRVVTCPITMDNRIRVGRVKISLKGRDLVGGPIQDLAEDAGRARQ